MRSRIMISRNKLPYFSIKSSKLQGKKTLCTLCLPFIMMDYRVIQKLFIIFLYAYKLTKFHMPSLNSKASLPII